MTPIPKDIKIKLKELHKKYRKCLEKRKNEFGGVESNFSKASNKAYEFIFDFSKIMDDTKIRQITIECHANRSSSDKSTLFDFDEFRNLIAAA